MQLNANKLALAAAITSALLWLLGLLFVQLFSFSMVDMAEHMGQEGWSHMGWNGTQGMPFAFGVIGLIFWPVFSALAAWLLATVYNKLL